MYKQNDIVKFHDDKKNICKGEIMSINDKRAYIRSNGRLIKVKIENIRRKCFK